MRLFDKEEQSRKPGSRAPAHSGGKTRLGVVIVALCALTAGCSREQKPVVTGDAPTTRPTREDIRRFDDLSIELLMQGPGLVGTSPSRVSFSADGASVYFYWNDPAKLDSLNQTDPLSAYEHYVSLQEEAGYYRLDVVSGVITALDNDTADATVPSDYAWDHARSRCAQIRGGDLYLADRSGNTRRITQTVDRESDVQILNDGTVVFFVRGDNLYAIDWDGGPVRQMTNLEAADKPEDKKPSAQRQFLIDQQQELFADFQREEREPRRQRPHAVYLGAGWSIDDIRVSASGRYAAVEISKEADAARRPLISHFVTESGYMETSETRSKVGDLRDGVAVAIVDMEGDSLIAIDIDDSIMHTLRSWSPAGDVLLTRGITDNFKTRYFYALEPDKPGSDGRIKPRVLDEFNDDAWVGGPGFYGTGDWLSDGSGIYYLCEKDGFSHVYTATTDGTRHEKLTDGAWETYSVRQSHDGSRWYLISNEGETGSHRLWVMDRDGSNRTVLTPDVGQYRPVFSADEKKIAILRSTLTSPPELYMFDVEEARLSGALTTSTTELYRTFAWLWPEVLSIRGDGGDFRAHIIRPEMFGKRPNGAGVVFIHGAGYLQNVMSWWSYYYREYMFNHFLALNGYTVLNIDYRGSAGYGRDCRTAIHRHMGGRDLDDVIDAARYLVREEGVNEDKVGVYGGSYGGFLTIMALFKYPDVIEAGGAIRSVTDWAHYNHWYTSRILGLPEEDPEAYKQSSPINFVDGFKGGLLMLHGLVDANVLAADVLRLSQVLIEKGKDDWDLVLYPVEGHAFARASSWTDEYKRIFKLFEERLAGK